MPGDLGERAQLLAARRASASAGRPARARAACRPRSTRARARSGRRSSRAARRPGGVRTRLSFARARYLSPASTCSAQSRRKSTAKTASATKPIIATRKASCGVRRYGSSTRGSRRQEPLGLAIAASQGAAPRAPGRGARTAGTGGGSGRRPAASARRLSEQRDRQLARDDPRRGRLAEHEAQQDLPVGVEDRDDRDRQVRRVEAVARGRLAVAADPEAGDREQQRREAERAERRGVEQQAGRRSRRSRRRPSRGAARPRAARRGRCWPSGTTSTRRGRRPGRARRRTGRARPGARPSTASAPARSRPAAT